MSSPPAGDDAATACNLCGAHVPIASSTRWLKDGLAIVQCPSCSLVFRGRLPEVEEVERIYGASYFAGGQEDEGGTGYGDYLAEADNHRATARRRLRLLAAHVEPGRLLDVGCAAGFFLDEARKLGWTARGLDVSPEMTHHARSLGLDVVTGRFDQFHDDAPLRAITMWDTIEHVLDPRAELDHAARILEPGGILALSTGDVESLVARLSGRSWHLLTPAHHNYFFSPTTLRRYLSESGLRVELVRHLGGRYSVGYLLHKTKTVVGNPGARAVLTRAARSRLARADVPVNLFDIVTVVARRT